MQRTALILGTSSAVRDAVGHALIAAGHRVAVSYGETKPSGFFGVRCDLADTPSIESAFDTVERDLGAVEILVVDAGVLRNPQPDGAAKTDFGHAVRMGLQAVAASARRARAAMQRARWGRIVFLASPTAMPDELGPARYAAFSFNSTLVGLAESLTYELAADNITVNVVAPGLIEGDDQVQLLPGTRTHPMWNVPAERAGRPHEVAAAVAFLASDGAAYVNGTTLRVDGGIGIRPGVDNRM